MPWCWHSPLLITTTSPATTSCRQHHQHRYHPALPHHRANNIIITLHYHTTATASLSPCITTPQPQHCYHPTLPHHSHSIISIITILVPTLSHHIHNGESVQQSKSTHSQKPKLSMTEHGHQIDGWKLCARLCTCPEISSVRFCADLTKCPSDETINRGSLWVYACKKITHMHVKDPVVHVRIRWTIDPPPKKTTTTT